MKIYVQQVSNVRFDIYLDDIYVGEFLDSLYGYSDLDIKDEYKDSLIEQMSSQLGCVIVPEDERDICELLVDNFM